LTSSTDRTLPKNAIFRRSEPRFKETKDPSAAENRGFAVCFVLLILVNLHAISLLRENQTLLPECTFCTQADLQFFPAGQREYFSLWPECKFCRQA
jgi:hypothetical protein